MTRNKDSANKARYLVKNEDAASVAAISNLDDILAELCVSIDVDVAREVDARSDFYDVLNSSFVASSSEHLMDRVAKMSLPGEQAWIYLLSWS